MRLMTALQPLLHFAAPLTGKRATVADAEAAAAAAPEPMPSGVHIVREGDSIVRIAGLYGLSVYALMAANPQLMPSTDMRPGQRVALPSMLPGAPVAQRPVAAQMRPRNPGGAPRRVGQLAVA